MRIGLAVWMAGAVAVCGAAEPGSRVKARVDAAIRTFGASSSGVVSLYAKNIATGVSHGVREDEPVRTASTIKVPILVTLFAEVDAGRAQWDETVVLRAGDKVGGAGVLAEFSDGIALPLRDVARMMIVVSDNTATNLVLGRITADRVNEVLDELGLARTRSLRKILSAGGATGHSKAGREKANERYGIGVSTPREMAMLLEKIERGEAVSKAASAEMIAILKRQQFKDAIGRHTRYGVASKSGALDRLRSDVGIVYAPKGPVVLALTVDGLPETDYSPDNRGMKLLGELSNILVEELTR
ncbi:MAG: serine hydrolase [Bryobacteraceae bacterium]